jgi:hypothetical protein
MVSRPEIVAEIANTEVVKLKYFGSTFFYSVTFAVSGGWSSDRQVHGVVRRWRYAYWSAILRQELNPRAGINLLHPL